MRDGVGCQPADSKLTGALIRESVADGPAIDLSEAGRRRILGGGGCAGRLAMVWGWPKGEG